MIRQRHLYMGPETGTATAGVSGAGRNSRNDLVSMITQLAPTLFGTGKTTVSETSGKNITPEQLQALIGNMMSSNSGLASVLMPQRQAGLYNSNVNSLLAQQLTSRIAGEAADKSTMTTKTATQRTAASPAAGPLGTVLGLIQGGSMLKKGWDNKDAIAKFAKDPVDGIKTLLGIDGADFGPDISLANPAALDAAGFFGPASDLASTAAGISGSSMAAFGPDTVSALQSLGGSFDLGANMPGADAFQSLLSPEAVKNLGAGAFDMGDTVLNISGGSDAASAAAEYLGVNAADVGAEAGMDYLAAEGLSDAGMDLASVGTDAASMGIPYVTIARGASMLAEELFGNNVLTNSFEAVMEPVNEIVGGVISAGEDIIEGAGDFISDIGGGCFLTTACMVALAPEFKDDCRELEAMRAMRDGYMQTLDEGPQLIKEYYRNAPSYVMWINAREDAEDVWKHLYNDYILPAVVAYEKQHFHKSYETYVRMVKEVERLVHEEEGV